MNAAIPDRRPVTEEISGVIERVTFHNDDSGFCVLRVKTKGHREETTVVGSLASVSAGEWLVAEGCWVRDREHGLQQFKATTMKTVPPTTAEGIEQYLGSGLVKGIGPILAKKLVLRFGADVLAVIEKRVAELQSVDGIGPKRRERIAHAWQEAKQVREITAASSTVDFPNAARLLHSPFNTRTGLAFVSTPMTSFPCIAVSRSLFQRSFLIGTTEFEHDPHP
jgi:exodeoxyribonuclease V alpha subunit